MVDLICWYCPIHARILFTTLEIEYALILSFDFSTACTYFGCWFRRSTDRIHKKFLRRNYYKDSVGASVPHMRTTQYIIKWSGQLDSIRLSKLMIIDAQMRFFSLLFCSIMYLIGLGRLWLRSLMLCFSDGIYVVMNSPESAWKNDFVRKGFMFDAGLMMRINLVAYARRAAWVHRSRDDMPGNTVYLCHSVVEISSGGSYLPAHTFGDDAREPSY